MSSFAQMIIITIQQHIVACTDALHNIFIILPLNNVKELSKHVPILSINTLIRIPVNVCPVHKDMYIIKTLIFVKRRQLHVPQDSIMMTQLVFVDIVNLVKIITMSLKFVSSSIQTAQEACTLTTMLVNANIALQVMYMTMLFSSAEWTVYMIKFTITLENSVF